MNDPTVNDHGYHGQLVCNDAGRLVRQAPFDTQMDSDKPSIDAETQTAEK